MAFSTGGSTLLYLQIPGAWLRSVANRLNRFRAYNASTIPSPLGQGTPQVSSSCPHDRHR